MKKLCAVITALLMGLALATPVAHAKPVPPLTMILVGGHGDPTGANLETGLRANGWIPKGANKVNIVKIAYLADATRGEESTADATPKIVAAYNANCLGTNKCELHGTSAGTNPVIRASRALNLGDAQNPNNLENPNTNTKVVLHGSPNPVTGAWHSLNDQTFVDAFDPYSASFTVKEIPLPGMEHWYHQDDYAANKAPQCFNSAAILYMAAVFNSGVHWIQPKNGVHDEWIGPDGVKNREFGAAASTLTVSGNSPVKPTCPADGWYRTSTAAVEN
jgi:hypothetical protein